MLIPISRVYKVLVLLRCPHLPLDFWS